MKFSVFTASTPEWTPLEAAAILGGQGWDGVEWRITDQADALTPGFWAGNRCTWPFTGLEGRLDEIGKITRDAGLEFSAIGGYQRCDNHDGVERMLAATARLGAGRVRVTSLRLDAARDYRDLFEETREHFRWLAARAKEYGVTAMVELHPQTVISSASSALRLLQDIDPDHVSVIHDAGNHVYEGGEDTTASFQMLADRLTHVHIKNARWVATRGDETGTLAGTLHWAPEPTTLRLGQVDVVAYFRSLRSVGYDGWITVEDFSTELPLEERTADNLRYLKAAAQLAAEV